MADVFKQGGSAGQAAYVAVDDAGSLVVSDGSTTRTLTQAVLGGLANISAYVIDWSAATTGAAYFSLASNLAAAWKLRVGSTDLLTAITTTDKIRVRANVPFTLPAPVSVNVTSANKTLVFGATAGNNVALTSNLIVVENTSGASKDVTLPAIADLAGLVLFVFVGGNEGAVVKDSGGSAIVTISANKGAVIFNDGTNFGFIAGA